MNPPSRVPAQQPVLNHALLRTPTFAARTDVALPEPQLLALPERALVFGTGAFVRGFVCFFLDEANRQGRFGGRVVMVGSTGSGRDRAVNRQDGLYTLSSQGLSDGAMREERRVVGVVSRALSARDQWDHVLACARNPELELVFSNTTEVGIRLDEGDRPDLNPPRSFPGKLARFLLERARAFECDPSKAPVVIPCELIEDNGERLRGIVLALAERWGAEAEFGRWVRDAVPFCNTLVDRIVPGTPDEAEWQRWETTLGYRDELLTVCEDYRLFAIQAAPGVRSRLRFAQADPGIVLTRDVAPYRERKVRLLNGAHTLMVPVALLCGCGSVLDAMQHRSVCRFVRRVVLDELVPRIAVPGADAFARQVLERFANPLIRHALFDITLQGTTKMRVRVVPSLVQFMNQTGRVPEGIALGFAGYLLFMRGDLQIQRQAAGLPVPPDDAGAAVTALWQEFDTGSEQGLADLVRAACSDDSLWGTDLTRLPGFAAAVTTHLVRAWRDGALAAVEAYLSRQPE
jgi:tagaturonate reductase